MRDSVAAVPETAVTACEVRVASDTIESRLQSPTGTLRCRAFPGIIKQMNSMSM